MKLIIDIPTEFETDYNGDKFKDFFFRVRYDIEKGTLCGHYEKEIAEMFLKAFDESVQADDIGKVVEQLDNVLQDLNVIEVIDHIDFDSTIQTSLDRFLNAIRNEILNIVKKGGTE